MKKYTGLKHIIKATGYSFSGLGYAIKETAFRHELLLCLIGIPLAFYWAKDKIELLLLLSSLLMLLVVELINTAIEATVDRIGKDFHPLAKKAKDLGSAAVFVSMLICAMVWLVIVVPI
ncbi:diacylglycerol kinase [Volucribacter psittacicida]|uniref:Diacylglycerol kinase n=1 Tax=Volucribacter psittacicida TaxID=203482 RepID=A0A4R1FXJ9_9PAST|nr:diacylglycerol kinase [Volucribacter psittacicida]TCJ98960.1 diacylglycerol kinase [Volucribacter psittacicida]